MTDNQSPRENAEPIQLDWEPEPAFTGTRRMVSIADVRLECWDSPGDGPVVVLLHPHTASGAVWGYQHRAFAAAGHRVISFSRRGYGESEPGSAANTGTAVADLDGLMTALGVDRFHLVGSAAGGYAVFDYALSHPDRLRSGVLASTLAGIVEPEFHSVTSRILPEGWAGLPEDFQELGPSYRAANPAGVSAWLAHARHAVRFAVHQPPENAITWAAIESIRVPFMLLTGESDLYLPPSRMRQVALHLRSPRAVVLRESGHAAFWEQYRVFNDAVLAFFSDVARQNETPCAMTDAAQRAS